ncbi:MAG: DUF4288 domain-containing protein [Chthoniobacterales bacterium]
MWFVGNIFFRSAHEDPCDDGLWEERFVLLECETQAEAMKWAIKIGKDEEHSYMAATGKNVKWIFDSVNRVYPIEGDHLTHGAELFSRFLRKSEIKSLKTPFEEK